MKLTHNAHSLDLRLRIILDEDVSFGPGKAELLEHIAALGSISAAGRKMHMSYKRAWNLVDEMNRCFAAPLIESNRGGAHGGGAALTPLGASILAHYRSLETHLASNGEADLNAFFDALAELPRTP